MIQSLAFYYNLQVVKFSKKWSPSPISGHEDGRAAPGGLHRRLPRQRLLPLRQLRDRTLRHVRLVRRVQAG